MLWIVFHSLSEVVLPFFQPKQCAQVVVGYSMVGSKAGGQEGGGRGEEGREMKRRGREGEDKEKGGWGAEGEGVPYCSTVMLYGL